MAQKAPEYNELQVALAEEDIKDDATRLSRESRESNEDEEDVLQTGAGAAAGVGAAANEEDAEDADMAQDYSKFAAMMGSSGAASQTAKRTKEQISSQTIRRGEKDFEAHGTRAQSDALESSRAAMEAVLSYTRAHGVGGSDSVRGWYFPHVWKDEEDEEEEENDATANDDGNEDKDEKANRIDGRQDKRPQQRRFAHTRHRVVLVEAERGPVFASIGAVPGRKWIPGLPKDQQPVPQPGCDRVWLLPEEALFLVERGSMELWWPLCSLETILSRAGRPGGPELRGDNGDSRNSGEKHGPDSQDEQDGIPLSLQAAYALLIQEADRPGAGDTLLPQQYGRIPLPLYQVYTHLRRSGYQVMRAVGARSSFTRSTRSTRRQASEAEAEAETNTDAVSACPPQNVSLWQWLFSLISPATAPKLILPSLAPYGPLVRPGLYRSYRHVYAQLQLQLPPASRHPCPLQVAPNHTRPSSAQNRDDDRRIFKIDFHVWKSSATTTFSKTRPPSPNFLVSVADAHASAVPTLDDILWLLGEANARFGLDEAAGKFTTAGLGPVYRRLKQGSQNSVIIAVVDHGLVNYMRFGDGPFTSVPLWPRFDGLISSKGGSRGAKRGIGGEGQQKGKGNRKGKGKGKGQRDMKGQPEKNKK